MSDEKRDNGGVEGEGQPGAPEERPGDGEGREPSSDGEEPDERQPITLDRYMSRHRGRSAVSWPHVGALIIMLAILVALVMFKDRCGEAVSDIVFMLSPDASAPAKVRIELERPAAKPGNEAPTSKPSK
jgi:hypothetical protein